MITFLIELSRLIANIRWLWKKLFGFDPLAEKKLKEEIQNAYKIAKETKDVRAIAKLFNDRK